MRCDLTPNTYEGCLTELLPCLAHRWGPGSASSNAENGSAWWSRCKAANTLGLIQTIGAFLTRAWLTWIDLWVDRHRARFLMRGAMADWLIHWPHTVERDEWLFATRYDQVSMKTFGLALRIPRIHTWIWLVNQLLGLQAHTILLSYFKATEVWSFWERNVCHHQVGHPPWAT